jgi:hypothetical protein
MIEMSQADPTHRPNPTFPQLVWNLASSVAAFIADGCHTVTREQYQMRLEICSPCEDRQEGACTRCGCNLALKAQGRAFGCPLGKWPDLVDAAAHETSDNSISSSL